MMDVELAVVHCSATKEGVDIDIDVIDKMHRDRGFYGVGYHIVILLDGTIQIGRSLLVNGAHAKGYNSKSWSVCYIGGLDKLGKAKDTRTECQKESIEMVLRAMKTLNPVIKIIGHRDLSPDKNGDGKITLDEFMKMCPCYDAKEEYKNY